MNTRFLKKVVLEDSRWGEIKLFSEDLKHLYDPCIDEPTPSTNKLSKIAMDSVRI